MTDKAKTPLENITSKTSLPLIVGPMFLVSNEDLVLAACKEGIVGTFPAGSRWTSADFETFLKTVTSELDDFKTKTGKTPAPYSINLSVKKKTPRLQADLDLCEKYKVPIVHASGGVTPEIVQKIHGYGGIIVQDAMTADEARHAVAAGVDGIIAVASGAGGQAGTINPFVLLNEIRQFYDGLLVLAGSLSSGKDILAAQTLGADMVIMGTRFVATKESAADPAYKQMIVDVKSSDIIYTSAISGVPGNFIRQSIEQSGYDAENLRKLGPGADKIPTPPGQEGRAWKYVWSAGQTVGTISDIPTTADLATRLKQEYADAKAEMANKLGFAAPAAAKPKPPSPKVPPP